MEPSQIFFVGGTRHGQSIRVDANIEEIELEVHTSDSPTGAPLFVEIYERRHFEGDGFGEGMNCFALKSDDAVEQMELARWSYPFFLELRESTLNLITEDDRKDLHFVSRGNKEPATVFAR